MAKLVAEPFVTRFGKKLVIRSAEPKDWESIAHYMNHLKTDSAFTYQYPEQREYTREEMEKRAQEYLDKDRALQIAVFDQDDVVAQLSFRCFHLNEHHPWLKHNCDFGMGVVKDYWSQGIGFRLLQIMEREARAMGYTQIFAEVRANNEAGLALYLKFGFEIVGRRKNAALIHGRYYDDLLIQKKIN